MKNWKQAVVMVGSWIALAALFVFLATKSAHGADEVKAMVATSRTGDIFVVLSKACEHPEIAKLVPQITLGEGYAIVSGKREFFCYGVKGGLVITLDAQASGWRIPVQAFVPMVGG